MQVTRRYMLPEDFLQSPWQEIDVSEAPKLFQQEPKTNYEITPLPGVPYPEPSSFLLF